MGLWVQVQRDGELPGARMVEPRETLRFLTHFADVANRNDRWTKAGARLKSSQVENDPLP
jgi:hypothetical protein